MYKNNKKKLSEIEATLNLDLAKAEQLLEVNHIPTRKEMILAIAYLKNILRAIEKELMRSVS